MAEKTWACRRCNGTDRGCIWCFGTNKVSLDVARFQETNGFTKNVLPGLEATKAWRRRETLIGVLCCSPMAAMVLWLIWMGVRDACQ